MTTPAFVVSRALKRIPTVAGRVPGERGGREDNAGAAAHGESSSMTSEARLQADDEPHHWRRGLSPGAPTRAPPPPADEDRAARGLQAQVSRARGRWVGLVTASCVSELRKEKARERSSSSAPGSVNYFLNRIRSTSHSGICVRPAVRKAPDCLSIVANYMLFV